MDIWDCALGFMDAQVLLTAEELGVFNHLASGVDRPAAIASEVGIPGDSAERLLTALCALGLVRKKSDGTYANSDEAEEKLVRGRPGYIGAMFRHVREDLYPVWHHFKDALIEGDAQWKRLESRRTPEDGKLYEDPEALRHFMDGMHPISYDAAKEFASYAPELGKIKHLVDVGGAAGSFVIALAEAFPNLKATVLDLPAVRPVAEDYFHRFGLTDRLRFQAGDFWEDTLPEGADAYSLGFILHDWNTEGGSHLLRKIANVMQPGGLLIVGEYLLNDDKTGPLWVARSNLNMLVAARGRERSAKEYFEWFESFGFASEKIYQTSKGKCFILARYVGTNGLAKQNGQAKKQRTAMPA